jgi:hypothetical protein
MTASKNKKSDFSLISAIIILAVFCLLDLPILKEAQSTKAQTPTIRQTISATGSPQIEIIYPAPDAKKELKQLKNEINKEINLAEKILKKTEKLIGSQIYKKYGLDEDLLKARVSEMKTNLSLATKKYKAGEFDDAREILQIIKNAGTEDVFDVYNGVRKTKEKIKIIKNNEVKEIIYNLLEEVISSANEGNFYKANLALKEMEGELFRLADKYTKNKSYLSSEMREKFGNLEIKIIKILQEK